MMKCKFQLYVADNKPRSVQARKQIIEVFRINEGESYELEIIDIEKAPSLAEENKIFAIPTLIKVSPLPVKRVIGDLTNTEKLMAWLASCYLP